MWQPTHFAITFIAGEPLNVKILDLRGSRISILVAEKSNIVNMIKKKMDKNNSISY